MSAPNLILTNSIYGNTTFLSTNSLTPQNILANAGGSGLSYKLNTIMVANPNGQNVPVSVDVSRNGVSYPLAANVSVSNNSTSVLQNRTATIYLIEGDTLRCNVGVVSTCHFTVSYEVIG